ncbi:hypothetical protein [Nannocystis pusilla]|uniref:hypothetical protein n=1 Tax=Nannocystis pusilla TaxID=889268 RepID=UPI003B7CFF5B
METNSGKLIKFEQLPTQGQYSQDQILGVLQLLAENPAALQQMLRCAQQYPEVQRQLNQAEDRCRTMQTKCDTLEGMCRTLDMLVRSFLCPGNVNFSQRTLDEYSGKSQIKLVEVVKDLGDPYVNAFPIPPGKKIRLTHKPRPGYTPTEIRIDMNIAGNGNNYSDFTIQFYLQPLNLDIGDEYDGNIFLNKDGTQIAVRSPSTATPRSTSAARRRCPSSSATTAPPTTSTRPTSTSSTTTAASTSCARRSAAAPAPSRRPVT